MMKLGIVGAGLIVQEFLPQLVKLEGLDVVGVMDIPASLDALKALCEQNGVAHSVTNFEALCETGIDTVYVAVPNFLHYDYCVKALERGLNVIVEKPMCSNAAETERLRDMACAKHCFLFEAVTTPYLGTYQKIRDWLPRIGMVKLVQSQYSQYSRRYDAFRAGKILPAFDPQKAGGALMDLGLYCLHFVIGLFGSPKQAVYHANIERGIDTSGVMTMEYDDFRALCVCAKDCKGPYGSVIQGTDGVIRCAFPANVMGKVTLELNDGTKEEFDDGSQTRRLIPEFTAFLRAIDTKDHAFADEMLAQSLAVSRVQSQARQEAGIRFATDEAL